MRPPICCSREGPYCGTGVGEELPPFSPFFLSSITFFSSTAPLGLPPAAQCRRETGRRRAIMSPRRPLRKLVKIEIMSGREGCFSFGGGLKGAGPRQSGNRCQATPKRKDCFRCPKVSALPDTLIRD